MTLVSAIPAVEPKSDSRRNNTSKTELLTEDTETMIYPDASTVDVKTDRKAIKDLFEQTLAENGEIEGNKFKWVGENEIQADGLSGMTLHNFVLKAEALGKKVTYRRSIVFTITDK